jgi:hypothetical protein
MQRGRRSVSGLRRARVRRHSLTRTTQPANRWAMLAPMPSRHLPQLHHCTSTPLVHCASSSGSPATVPPQCTARTSGTVHCHKAQFAHLESWTCFLNLASFGMAMRVTVVDGAQLEGAKASQGMLERQLADAHGRISELRQQLDVVHTRSAQESAELQKRLTATTAELEAALDERYHLQVWHYVLCMT